MSAPTATIPFAAAPAEQLISPAITVEDRTSSLDIVHWAFQRAQLSGEEPFAISDHFDTAFAPLHALPIDATTYRIASTTATIAVYATTPRGNVLLHNRVNGADAWVSSTSLGQATDLLDGIKTRASGSGA